MTAGEFRDLLAARIAPGFSGHFGALLLQHSLWREAMEMAFDSDIRVAFRASAALENAYFTDPVGFAPHRDEFLNNYLRIENPSAHRHYGKMLEHLLRTNSLTLTEQQAEQVAEKTFDLLIDPEVRVAVKAWAMDILYELVWQLPWIGPELDQTVRHLMSSGASPGILSRGRKLCKRLKR